MSTCSVFVFCYLYLFYYEYVSFFAFDLLCAPTFSFIMPCFPPFSNRTQLLEWLGILQG